jgi:hypothetical protein
MEWLSECTVVADCSLPVAIRITRDAEATRALAFDFTLYARLEYLETATPPIDATLELTAD